MQPTFEKFLYGRHGADGGSVEDIEEEGLDNIVLMVTKSDLPGPDFRCRSEKGFPSQP